MRIFLLLAALAAAPVALAGDRPSLAGCDCANECPLAQAVHTRRTYGEEAAQASKLFRDELVRVVVANLRSI